MTPWPAPSTSSAAADQRVARAPALTGGMTTSSLPCTTRVGGASAPGAACSAACQAAIAASWARSVAGDSAARAAATTSPNWRSISAASGAGKSSEISRLACSRGVPEWSVISAQTAAAAGTAAAPPGSEEISASALTRCGARSASRWATKPPIDQPTTGRRPIPSASSSASMSAAIASIVSSASPSGTVAGAAVVGVDHPVAAFELGEEGRVPVRCRWRRSR